MSFLSDFIPILLEGAKTLADGMVDGKELNEDQLSGLYNTRNIIRTHGKKIAEQTDNDYDNVTLDKLAEFAEDTLIEAGIEVPVLPDFKTIAENNGTQPLG